MAIVMDGEKEGGEFLWERQEWDTPASWRAFHTFYLSQTPPRSVCQAYRAWYAEQYGLNISDEEVKRRWAPGCWQNWSRGRKGNGTPIEGTSTWAERASAYDSHLAQQDRALWEERRLEEIEAEWKDAQALRKRAADMQQFPLQKVERVEELYEDGRPKQITIIIPVGWRAGDIARYRDTAAKLGRLAAAMTTEKARTDLLNIDVTRLTDEQVRRIANGEDPMLVLATSGQGGSGTAATREED